MDGSPDTRETVAAGAIEVLQSSEATMQSLLSEAAGSGNYSDVEWLTRCAKQLRDMRELAERMREGQSTNGTRVAEAHGHTRSAPHANRRATRRRAGRAGYPRFLRTDDQLVKIGWSKKKRSEYIHKAPRERVFAVVEAVAAAGGNGAVMSTEDLLAIQDESGEEIPQYQTYLALAWLRSQGVIRRHGRTGYKIEDHDRALGGFGKLWDMTPQDGKP